MYIGKDKYLSEKGKICSYRGTNSKVLHSMNNSQEILEICVE